VSEQLGQNDEFLQQVPQLREIVHRLSEIREKNRVAGEACDALNLPPDKLEASVLALVEAARAWHECSMVSDTWFDMKTHGLDEALARSEALIVALAPFAHLGGEP